MIMETREKWHLNFAEANRGRTQIYLSVKTADYSRKHTNKSQSSLMKIGRKCAFTRDRLYARSSGESFPIDAEMH